MARVKEDISIVCFLWNNFPNGKLSLSYQYVNKLYNAVKRNLTLPFRFFCFTDFTDLIDFSGFEKDIIFFPIDIEGKQNIKKMMMFKPNAGLTGRVLAIDLDTVIISNIDKFTTIDDLFVVRKAFKSKIRSTKHLRYIGGDFISFNVGFGAGLYYIAKNCLKWLEEKTNGSERSIYNILLQNIKISFWQDLFPGCFLSYKYNIIRNQKEESGKPYFISFHGKPKQHEVEHNLVKKNWI